MDVNNGTVLTRAKAVDGWKPSCFFLEPHLASLQTAPPGGIATDGGCRPAPTSEPRNQEAAESAEPDSCAPT
jgi:hypothetical protein